MKRFLHLSHWLFSASLSLFGVTFARAENSVNLNITQYPVYGGEFFKQSNISADSMEPIEIQYADIPTTIRVEVTGSRFITASNFRFFEHSSRDCSHASLIKNTTIPIPGIAQEEVTLNMHRKPICSFRLNENSTDNVSVIFKGPNGYQVPYSTNKTTSTNVCVDICSSAKWAKYALSLEILVNNQRETNHRAISLFSDTHCTEEKQVSSNFRNGDNLIDATRYPNKVDTKCFLIYQL